MKRFTDVKEALKSFGRSVKVINSLPDDYQMFGRIILWHLYNICEAALYVCCAHDASISGTITFPSLRELPKFDKIPEMDIPRDVRNATKVIWKCSKPDLEHDIEQRKLFDAIQALKVFLKWICDNTKVKEIKFELEHLLVDDVFNVFVL